MDVYWRCLAGRREAEREEKKSESNLLLPLLLFLRAPHSLKLRARRRQTNTDLAKCRGREARAATERREKKKKKMFPRTGLAPQESPQASTRSLSISLYVHRGGQSKRQTDERETQTDEGREVFKEKSRAAPRHSTGQRKKKKRLPVLTSCVRSFSRLLSGLLGKLTGRNLPSFVEELSYTTRANADEDLHKLAATDRKKRHSRLSCYRLSEVPKPARRDQETRVKERKTARKKKKRIR